MKKHTVFISALIFALFVMPSALADITCTAKTSCSSGEAYILGMSARTNAHAALPSHNSYQYRLCCSGHGIQSGTAGDFAQDILRISSQTNAHSCAGCGYSYIVRFSFDDPTVTDMECSYVSSGNCLGPDSCIIGLSGMTNAHVADCASKPSNYGAICCHPTLDTVPPQVDDNYYQHDGQWVNSPQTILISAEDSDSGVDKIRYAWLSGCNRATCSDISYSDACVTDCSSYSGSDCSVSVSQNTNDRLCYYAIDNAQNPSEWGYANVKTDLTAPSTTCTNCPSDGSIVGYPFTIELSATDISSGSNKESGIDKTYFCYYTSGGSCSYQEYTEPVTISQTGRYTIKYYSVDVAGNQESSKQRIITYDDSLPVCQFSSSLPAILNTRDVHLEWTASDAVTGSTFVEYSIIAKTSTDGGQTFTQTVGNPITISTESQTSYDIHMDEDNTYRFECVVTYDRDGNRISSSPGLYTVTVDTESSQIEFTGNETEYSHTETFTISWTVDDINNIDHYVIEINGNVVQDNIPGSQTSMEYTGENGGTYNIELTAYDIAGNPSNTAEKTIVVDTVAPACSMNELPDYMNVTAFALEWTGVDEDSGVESYDICIMQDSSSECTQPTPGWSSLESSSKSFTGNHGKTYTIRCRAKDLAGNIGEWSPPETVTIDTRAPDIGNIHFPSTVISSDYSDMTINVTVSDDVGIEEVSLHIGGSEPSPSYKSGSVGDSEWTIVWNIPYDMYATENEFSISLLDVNGNADTESFSYSLSQCSPGEERPCNPVDPSGNAYTMGVCRGTGTRICQVNGSWGSCTGGTFPSTEKCNNLDDDCDGNIDEDLDNSPCGPDTDMGICEYGTKDCIDGLWTVCRGAVYPQSAEDCSNNLDDDCDGIVNEGCECTTDGEKKPCGESNIGACKLGESVCTNGEWGDCMGAIYPSTEYCGDGIDNDCDGFKDCEDSDCIGDIACAGAGVGGTGGESGGGYTETPEPFPWWILSLIGVIILVALVILWLYFKKEGEELTWENLKRKWTPVEWI